MVVKEYYFETVDERNKFIEQCYTHTRRYSYSDRFIDGHYIVKVFEYDESETAGTSE